MSTPYITFRYMRKPFSSLLPSPMLHVVRYPAVTTWEQVKEQEKDVLRPVRREWDAYAWPGGYPIYYVTADNGVLCPKCANKNLHLTLDKSDKQWFIVAADINYEDSDLYCDNCNKTIDAAYSTEGGE